MRSNSNMCVHPAASMGWSSRIFSPSCHIYAMICFLIVMVSCFKAQAQDEVCKALSAQIPITFDIISIKQDAPNLNTRSQDITSDAVILAGYNLRSLIHFAFMYNIENIRGGPSWADRINFDITAKVSEKDVSAVGKMKRLERRAMLRAVLCDSFGLQLSVDKKLEPGFYLVIDKHGPKLRTSANQGNQKVDNPSRGELTISSTSISGRSVGMETLIRYLNQITGRSVIDKTGLRGTYDFDLTLASDSSRSESPSDQTTGPEVHGSDSESIFSAIRDQLGLKLVPDKIPTDVLLINSAKMPALN